MKRLLALVAVLALAPLSSCTPAEASPRQMFAQVATAIQPASEFQLFLVLNGSPRKLGVLTSTGTSVTNATTGVPFTVTTTDCATRVFLFKCDASNANVGAGSTCDTTITGANHRYQIGGVFEPYYLRTDGTTHCLDAPAATTINCAEFCME